MPTHFARAFSQATGLGAFALMVTGLAISAGAQLAAQKGKPASIPNSVVAVTLADRTDEAGTPTDGLTSDTGQPYPGATVFGPSGDLLLELAPMSRRIVVRLGEPGSVATDAGAVPSQAVIETDAALFVQDIRSVPRGTTATRVARIGLGAGYPNHALGFRYTTAQGITIYGTSVCVTRRAEGATWDISSSCPAETSDTAGLFEENLKGKVNHRFKATYTVPFAATVTCTNSCPQ